MAHNLGTWEGRYAAAHNMAKTKFGDAAILSNVIQTGEFQGGRLGVTAMRSRKDRHPQLERA